MRRRSRGQSVVEFGIVALVFTLLAFAVIDFGLLLNTWIRLSSGVREVGRAVAVGYDSTSVNKMLNQLVLPGVTHNVGNANFTAYCCDPTHNPPDALVLHVAYYVDPGQPPHCMPGDAGCTAIPYSAVDSNFWQGTCTGTCPHPAPGDLVVVTLEARGMQVLTPLVRPFFGCSGQQGQCFVRLGSTTMMRYEGRP